MKWRERICIRQADLVISVSRSLVELRKQQQAKQVMLVPNGVDSLFFRTSRVKRSHPPTLIFIGSLYFDWGIDLPIYSLPAIKSRIPDIRYIVIGDGPDKDAFRTLAYEKMNCQDCVFFFGRQNYRKLPDFLSEADIGVLAYRNKPFIQYASSLKVLEYMAAGLPVVGTRVGDLTKVIEESRAGVVVDHTPQDFAEAVVNLFQDPIRYKEYSNNAMHCAAKHDWEIVLNPLKDLLDHFPFSIRG